MVITIITILIALLLPALTRARSIARDSVCLSNQRQTAISVLTYSDDFKDAVPIHWGQGSAASTMYQDIKAPSSRWIFMQGWGKTRAGATFPYYNNGKTFYCPTDKSYYFDRPRISGQAPIGLKFYNTPNISDWYGGQFYVSYLFPAVVVKPITTTNWTGAWTGVPNEYWATKNSFWGIYSAWYPSSNYWYPAMLSPRVTDNQTLTNPMLWDRNGLHDSRLANVTYWDGSAQVYPYYQKVYGYTFSSYGSRGMTHPQIVNWLRRWRTEHYVP